MQDGLRENVSVRDEKRVKNKKMGRGERLDGEVMKLRRKDV